MSELEDIMPLFAGFALLLLAYLSYDHFARPVGPDLSRAGRRAAILEMQAQVTVLLERDNTLLKSRFQVTDYQVRSYYDQHPDKFLGRDGVPKKFIEVRDAALELATGEHHDQVMKAYLDAARAEVDFREGPAAQVTAHRMHLVRSAKSGDNTVLAVAGKRVVDQADLDLFLELTLDEHQRAQVPQTPGAREFYLKRLLDLEVLAAKARAEGLK